MIARVLRRYGELPDAARWAVGLAVIVVMLNIVAAALDALYGGASDGPSSSTYTTASEGAAAYAELLGRSGHDVERLREAPATAELDPDDTILVLGPPRVGVEDAAALAGFLERGGRLVVAVDRPAPWLDAIFAGAPEWSATGVATARPFVPVAETAGVTTVAGAGTGSWSDANASLPILGNGRTTAAAADVGAGRVVLVADATVLHNRFLARDDNASFALAIAGNRRRAVFVETYHGYTEATGFGALPASGRASIALFALAAVAGLIAYGRRFGPPDRTQRALPPRRTAYVDALAWRLRSIRDPNDALASLRREARAALAHRVHVPSDAGDDQLTAAARSHGLERAAERVLRPIRTDDDVVHLGRTALRLVRGMR